jgi:hypothetical protein
MPLENTPNQLRIELLTQACPQLKSLTFPRYQSFLDAPPLATDGQAFAVAAWIGDLPVGLALVSGQSDSGMRDLLSIQASPLFKRCGIAKQLLAEVERLSVACGTDTLMCLHSSRMSSAADFTAWLQHTGWDAPKEIEHRLAGHASWAERAELAWAPFLTRLRRNGFATTPWSNINDEDRHTIRQLIAHQFTERERITGFDPFPYEADETLVLPISLILRQHGQVVGWILGNKQAITGSQVFSYPRAFILPVLRKAGWWVGGIHAVCRRQADAFGEQSLSIFEMSPIETNMHRFVERHIKPYSVWTDIRYESIKTLTHKSANDTPPQQ